MSLIAAFGKTKGGVERLIIAKLLCNYRYARKMERTVNHLEEENYWRAAANELWNSAMAAKEITRDSKCAT